MKMCLLSTKRERNFSRGSMAAGSVSSIMVETFNQNFILKLEEGCFRLSNLNWVN